MRVYSLRTACLQKFPSKRSGDSGRIAAIEDKLEPSRTRPWDKEKVERVKVTTMAFTVWLACPKFFPHHVPSLLGRASYSDLSL